MPAPDSPRLALLRAAVALLSPAADAALVAVRVTIESDGASMVVTSRPGELEPAPDPTLTRPEHSILMAATTTPTTARRLARQLARSCNSHFRALLSGLVRRGLLLHTPEGYRLP